MSEFKIGGAERTLMLHIGTHKTGSSSIQFAAMGAAEALRSAGTHIARTGSGDYTTPHHNLAYEMMGLPGFRPDKGTLAQLERELAEVDTPNVLISSESLCGKPDALGKYIKARRMADQLGRKLVIVIYLRDQLSYINSLYAFGVRRFAHAITFDEYLQKMRRHSRLRYFDLVQPWNDVADQMIVRKYTSNVVADFYDLLNVEADVGYFANTGTGPKMVEATRLMIDPYRRFLAEHDRHVGPGGFNRRSERMGRLASSFGWNEQRYWGFDPRVAARVMAIHAEQNDRLRATYGIAFDDAPVGRGRSVFDPQSAGGEERADFDQKRALLWAELVRGLDPAAAPPRKRARKA